MYAAKRKPDDDAMVQAAKRAKNDIRNAIEVVDSIERHYRRKIEYYENIITQNPHMESFYKPFIQEAEKDLEKHRDRQLQLGIEAL